MFTLRPFFKKNKFLINTMQSTVGSWFVCLQAPYRHYSKTHKRRNCLSDSVKRCPDQSLFGFYVYANADNSHTTRAVDSVLLANAHCRWHVAYWRRQFDETAPGRIGGGGATLLWKRCGWPAFSSGGKSAGRAYGRACQPASRPVLPHVCDFECLSRSKSGDATRHDATTSACPIDRRRFNFLFDAGEPLRRSRVIILLPHTADCSVSHFRAANVSLLSSSVALTAVDLISLLNLFYVLSALVIQIHFWLQISNNNILSVITFLRHFVAILLSEN